MEDVGHEDGLLASLRVLVLDDCLGHEVVHVVLLLELVVVYLGVDVDCLLLVDELLAELGAVFFVDYVCVLAAYLDFVGPDDVLSIYRGSHLLPDVFDQVLSRLVLIY